MRRSISRSFRSVPALLAFVNDLCHDVDKAPARRDAFRYDEEDRFPAADRRRCRARSAALGHRGGPTTPEACAETTAAEIARLIAEAVTVRDRDTGVPRPIRAGDIAILFRTRESHREFEEALERRGIPSYVYKGLGFFDADEIKDVLALLWYLADPLSDLRAAALHALALRPAVGRGAAPCWRRGSPTRCAPRPPGAAPASTRPTPARSTHASGLDAAGAALVDRMPPAELLDAVLTESAYAVETARAAVSPRRART